MAKLIMAFTFCFVGASILTGFMAGGSGIAATVLDGAIDQDDTTITVDDNSLFLDNDYITIGDEIILTGGKDGTTGFTGCTRACKDTSAASHADGVQVYTTSASVINSAMGFSIAGTAATFGAFSVIVLPYKFFSRTLPHLVSWNFTFLQGDMAWVAYFFFAVSIGLIVVLAIQMLQVAQGIIRR